MEALNDKIRILQFHSPKLYILSGGYVHDALIRPVLFHAIRVKAHLVGINYTVWHLESHHELARRTFVPMEHTHVFEALSSSRTVDPAKVQKMAFSVRGGELTQGKSEFREHPKKERIKIL